MNILLITNIYPLLEKGDPATKVCHYFAKEWLKMGYTVHVVHFQAVFPRFLYWFARLAGDLIASKTGALVRTKRNVNILKQVMDGVPVTRIPLFKLIPHGKFSPKAISKSIDIIELQNEENGFMPDVIVGHFTNPMIEVLSRFKSIYRNVKTCIVVHGDIDLTKKVYGKRLPILMKDIDVWGFRSKSIQEEFEKKIASVEKTFVCYSGIPEDFISDKNHHTFRIPLKNFLYVGLMIERKYPVQILDALQMAYPDKDYHINYVGVGQQLDVVRQKIKEYCLEQQVSVLGSIPREEIKVKYDEADCMIMISRGEVYGLVYLEAMARGCITIASRNGGFDGIIEDGINGFLCKAGDIQELSKIIKRINAMTPEERQSVSDKALETAKSLTDSKAAKMYIDNIIMY